MSARTLQVMRAVAAPDDLKGEALTPPPSSLKSPYVDYDVVPQTLDALRVRCGSIGNLAVAEAQWSAVASWLLSVAGDAHITFPFAVVSLSIELCQIADRVKLGYPVNNDKHVTDIMAKITPDSQVEARVIAEQTIMDWKSAGSPHLDHAIKRAYQYIENCRRENTLNISKVIPNAPNH